MTDIDLLERKAFRLAQAVSLLRDDLRDRTRILSSAEEDYQTVKDQLDRLRAGEGKAA